MSDEQKIQSLCERLSESQQERKNMSSKVKQYEQLAKTVSGTPSWYERSNCPHIFLPESSNGCF